MPRFPRLWYRPAAQEPLPIHGDAPPFEGGRLRILSWNIQFCAGRRCLFFYDGGRDSRVTAAEVIHTLGGIAALIRSVEPDLVLLQEVDRRSARTAGLDQLQLLQDQLHFPVYATTPYFRVPYVPVPAHAPLGAVHMDLVVLSRYRLQPGTRIALPPLREPRWRRAFNLRRAIQRLTLPVGSGSLALLHTHLSAFSRGDGTLARQVRVLVDAIPSGPVLLAGDLNSLPPGDDAGALGRDRTLYDQPTPITPLYDVLQPVFPPPGRAPQERFTYVPWGSNRADRTIDYLFGRGFTVERVERCTDGSRWSDHLPVVADLVFG